MCVAVAGCDGEAVPSTADNTAPVTSSQRPVTGSADPAPRELPLVVFLGNSLTAGHGLSADQAFPALVEERLRRDGRPVRAVNAGVSGDTSAGGLSRIDWLLEQGPEIVVVGLGANDGLRGLSLVETESNLKQIIARCREAGSRVLLLGMKIPPSYGRDYAGGFELIYPRLATLLQVPLVPFLLADVAAEPALNLPDGIHPNVAGHQRLAENVLPYLEAILADL